MEAKQLSRFFNRFEDFSFFKDLSADQQTALSASIQEWEKLQSDQAVSGNAHLCKRHTRRMGLHIDEEVYNKVDPNDEYELWNAQGKLLGSSNGFYNLSSFSLEELFKKERSELFFREEKYTEQLIAAIGTTLLGHTMEQPVEIHSVMEKKVNPVRVEVAIRVLTPLRDASDKVVGVVAFLNLKKL